MKIQVTHDIQPDGEFCGECKYLLVVTTFMEDSCGVFLEDIDDNKRCPECLAAKVVEE